MSDKPKEKAPFCWNSRRWLDFEFRWCTCKREWRQTREEDCGYYEQRETTPYYRRKHKILFESND